MKRYTLYLGLNDKNSKTQKIDTVEAFKMVSDIISRHFDGGTVFNAQGIYKHNDGTVIIENTLRIEILEFDAPIVGEVKNVVNLFKQIFNQESVAVVQQDIASELW